MRKLKREAIRFISYLIAAVAVALFSGGVEFVKETFFPKQEGQVVRVSDGDSFIVRFENKDVSFRIQGIDAPELAQKDGNWAKGQLKELIGGKIIKVKKIKKDRHDRIVGHGYLLDETDIGVEMVRRGAAWWFQRFERNNSALKEAEQEARSKRIGIWKKSKEPTPPWEWRSKNHNNRR